MSYLSKIFKKGSLGVAKGIGSLTAIFSPSVFRAAYHKQSEKIEKLIAAGGDPNQPGLVGILPIQQASFTGHTETLLALLKGHADPKKMTDSMKIPALSLAAFNGRAEAVRLLLAWGADPLQKDGDGDCPMDYLKRSKSCSKDTAEAIKRELSEAIQKNSLPASALCKTEPE